MFCLLGNQVEIFGNYQKEKARATFEWSQVRVWLGCRRWHFYRFQSYVSMIARYSLVNQW